MKALTRRGVVRNWNMRGGTVGGKHLKTERRNDGKAERASGEREPP
jgi:hypothetical protein